MWVLIFWDGFALQLWPEKFQNKTNGVTPRRWLSFCNPELSAVITKWLGSEEWVLDTEKLAGLRSVCRFFLSQVSGYSYSFVFLRIKDISMHL